MAKMDLIMQANKKINIVIAQTSGSKEFNGV